VVSGAPLLELTDEQIEDLPGQRARALLGDTTVPDGGMVARGRGHVVTMASAAGLVGVARQTDYSASKHAAVGFDESLRVELSHGTAPGVRTTVVCPYYVDTGMFEGVRTRVPVLLPILRPEPVARPDRRRDREGPCRADHAAAGATAAGAADTAAEGLRPDHGPVRGEPVDGALHGDTPHADDPDRTSPVPSESMTGEAATS
jgi:NAD(P)-dependent dehydrogenase (short-subunit alcohol dehydrogenase family)